MSAIPNRVVYAQAIEIMALIKAAINNDLEASGQRPCQCMVCSYCDVYCIGVLWVNPHLDPHLQTLARMFDRKLK